MTTNLIFTEEKTMNNDKSSMQKLEMSLEGGGNCFIEQGNQQAAGNKCKNGMTTSPHLPQALLSIVFGVGKMMIFSWIQSEDWSITAGVTGETY